LAKTNFQFEKRQRELAKKRKKEDKLRRKQEGVPEDEPSAVEPGDGSAGSEDSESEAPPAAPAA